MKLLYDSRQSKLASKVSFALICELESGPVDTYANIRNIERGLAHLRAQDATDYS